jgi:hypothetical protein
MAEILCNPSQIIVQILRHTTIKRLCNAAGDTGKDVAAATSRNCF